MEALGISNSDLATQLLNREKQNPSFKTTTTEDRENHNTMATLENILEIIPPDEFSDGHSSDLDLGLGIESGARQMNSPEWEFDPRRADL